MILKVSFTRYIQRSAKCFIYSLFSLYKIKTYRGDINNLHLRMFLFYFHPHSLFKALGFFINPNVIRIKEKPRFWVKLNRLCPQIGTYEHSQHDAVQKEMPAFSCCQSRCYVWKYECYNSLILSQSDLL